MDVSEALLVVEEDPTTRTVEAAVVICVRDDSQHENVGTVKNLDGLFPELATDLCDAEVSLVCNTALNGDGTGLDVFLDSLDFHVSLADSVEDLFSG